MPKRVITEATYVGDAQSIFHEAISFGEMQDAMKGLARYDGLPDEPASQGAAYSVDVTVLKLFKTKAYKIQITRLDTDALILESQESGGLIRRWNHRLSVTQRGEHTVWIDDVTLDAGVMSAFVARFAAYMYRRRHCYRKALTISTDIKPVV